jgi:hypothetical protein
MKAEEDKVKKLEEYKQEKPAQLSLFEFLLPTSGNILTPSSFTISYLNIIGAKPPAKTGNTCLP